MNNKKIDFFFDLASPYSYLAATQLPALAERCGAELVWRPMVLGAVFKATGNDMPARIVAKGKWMGRDLGLWAEQYGVPFRFSSHFPINGMSAMRLIVFAEAEGKAAAVAQAAFRAGWVEDRDLTADETLRALAGEAGLDVERAMAAIADPAVKAALRAHTDEAIARGVFGAPAMFVGEQLFWGNDRLHFVEEALKKPIS